MRSRTEIEQLKGGKEQIIVTEIPYDVNKAVLVKKIDDVRAITNHSSGKLGKAIAESFAKDDVTIDMITTRHAVKPEGKMIHHHLIDSTADLEKALKDLMKKNTYDAVIHSMAVSDFTPEVRSLLKTLKQ